MSSHLHCDGQELPIIATDVRFDESLELVGTGHGSVCKLLIGARPIVPACTRVGRRDQPVKRRCSVASSWPLRLEFWGVRSAALRRTSDPGSYAESDPALAGDDHEPSRLRSYIYLVRVPRLPSRTPTATQPSRPSSGINTFSAASALPPHPSQPNAAPSPVPPGAGRADRPTGPPGDRAAPTSQGRGRRSAGACLAPALRSPGGAARRGRCR